jgi:hypothetical protein
MKDDIIWRLLAFAAANFGYILLVVVVLIAAWAVMEFAYQAHVDPSNQPCSAVTPYDVFRYRQWRFGVGVTELQGDNEWTAKFAGKKICWSAFVKDVRIRGEDIEVICNVPGHGEVAIFTGLHESAEKRLRQLGIGQSVAIVAHLPSYYGDFRLYGSVLLPR